MLATDAGYGVCIEHASRQVLLVRVWRPLKRELCPAVDAVIKRKSTARQLREWLSEHLLACTAVEAVGIVKVLSMDSNPPLNKLASLDWNNPSVH